MSVEQKINYRLNKYPIIKKIIKKTYQIFMYSISKKIKSQGDIIRISPNDNKYEYFFGYYDKSPWDITDRYILCLRANNTWIDVSPKEKADIIIIDTTKSEDSQDRIKKIAETNSWNVQQGCMLQWLGPDFFTKIIYNDYRNGKYCSVILTLDTMEERIIHMPIYSVSSDGKFALTLDFSRLYNLRPGYGYYNVPEKTKGIPLPDNTAIWKIDIEKNEVIDLLKYTDFANFHPRTEMEEAGSVHKVNHIMISPNNKRFMVLYRWFNGNRKYSRLITCNIDGTDMYVLSDDDMVSHCFWKNEREILAFENKKEIGPGYYLMKDKTQEYIHCWPQFSNDGHPSYSPDRSKIVTDSYPNRERIASINIMDGDETKKNNRTIAKVFAPFRYDNDTRCDLHPRWNNIGDKVCFDSVFDGKRGLYYINIPKTKKYNIVFVFTSCKSSGPIQIMYDLILNINKDVFNPILITIYEEDEKYSRLKDFLDLNIEYHYCKLGKKDILLNKTFKLKTLISDLNPNIIHTMGVFPEYAVSKMRFNCQVITLHNYMYDDYVNKFGFIKGKFLEILQIMSIKKSKCVWTCSNSLSDIYKLKDKMTFKSIQNGVNIKKFNKFMNNEQIKEFRKKLNINDSDLVIISVGQFIPRKNQEFILEVFSKYSDLKNIKLIFLGEGINLENLKTKYMDNKQFIFMGNVSDVENYLNISDLYISSSISEGLPTSVLEAMSCGLPSILSDIPQHKEIVEINKDSGVIFSLDNYEDCHNKIIKILNENLQYKSKSAIEIIKNNFSSEIMTKNYEKAYLSIINNN